MKPLVKLITPLVLPLLITGCGNDFSLGKQPGAAVADKPPASENADIPKPAKSARTAEQFDTTTQEQRVEATASVAGGRKLGSTIGSLGDVSEPGFWLKTPLVSKQQQGRVTYTANGKSVKLTLIPIKGPIGGGSRVSLAALRLLEAPLTGLPELIVYGQ